MFKSIVEAVFHYAETKPEAFCLADDTVSVTYKEYALKIRQFAACFTKMGITKSQKIVVEACQTVDYLAIELALQLIGAVFVPVEHNCATEKVCSFIERVHGDTVIARKTDGYKGYTNYTYDSLAEMARTVTPYEVTQLPKSEDVSEILFSTGTTGKEKGIVITHKNNIALAENVMYGVEMEKDNVEMIPSPLNHSHGLRRYYANMFCGCSVVILSSVMNVMKFFKNIEDYGVTAIDLVPSALTVVLRLSKNKFSEYQNQLRYIQYGAAPLMEQDKAKICELLPQTRMYNFYGSTESGCTCIYNFNQPGAKSSCIGKPTHSTTLLIVDDDRKPIVSSPDNTGLLATKGNMNMSEYFEDAEETEKVLTNGTVYSNDIGYVDGDGDVILLGRKGDVINVAGNKVSPDEIENVAKEMDEIADCGCIPVPDDKKGNVPKLIVQMKAGGDFDPVKIRGFLACRLEPYKVPQYIEQINKIPRSYNGKLLRKELK